MQNEVETSRARFSDKTQVNLLTTQLYEYGVRHIVVCAGARNGILVHNFAAYGKYVLHSAVDERSAAFMAIGLTLASGSPACICVTSGSALLGTLPAVAEAYYRRLPLLVISADRPEEWIGQLDGQTIPQVGALAPYAKTYNIPEPHTESEKTFGKRKLNEALLALQQNSKRPVHINVPLTEPLFNLTVDEVQAEECIHFTEIQAEDPLPQELIEKINEARLPALLIGQYEETERLPLDEIEANDALLVLPEIVANCSGAWRTDILEHYLQEMDFDPDLLIHIGGNSVHKRLRNHLRGLRDCKVIRIDREDDIIDTYSALVAKVKATPAQAVRQLGTSIKPHATVATVKNRLCELRSYDKQVQNAFSDLGVMQKVCSALSGTGFTLHLANSSVVRNACRFFDGGDYRIYCNRGVNGIEGSVSVAAGYALAAPEKSILLCGDLSFLYDQNGLWSTELSDRLRILVFNNGGGRIFRQMPALNHIEERDTLIAARHKYSMKGVAETFDLQYFSAKGYEDLEKVLPDWLNAEYHRPALLEVFTSFENQ